MTPTTPPNEMIVNLPTTPPNLNVFVVSLERPIPENMRSSMFGSSSAMRANYMLFLETDNALMYFDLKVGTLTLWRENSVIYFRERAAALASRSQRLLSSSFACPFTHFQITL